MVPEVVATPPKRVGDPIENDSLQKILAFQKQFKPKEGDKTANYPLSDWDPNLVSNLEQGGIQSTGQIDFGLALGAFFAGPSILSAAGWAYKPMTWAIPGLGGVTGDAILNAYMLAEGITDMPAAIKELKENPNLSTLGRVGMDLLMVAPATKNVYDKTKGTVQAIKDRLKLVNTNKKLYDPGTVDVPFDVVDDLGSGTISSVKELKAGEVSVRYGKETLEEMLRPIDLKNFTVNGRGDKLPKNLTFFGPADRSGNYNFPGQNRNRFEARIEPKNPLVLNMTEVWTVERIQDIMSQGHDAIVITDAIGEKVIETIPLDKSIIKIVNPTTTVSEPTLQQLAKDYQGERGVRTKKGGYMGEGSPYVESNAAMSGENIKNSPGVEEAADYYPERISGDYFGGDPDAMLSLDQQINLFKTEIARVKEEKLLRTHMGEGEGIGYDDYLAQLEKGLEISLSGLEKPTTNPGVYQYPSLVEGGPLEKSVKATDGTILRSIVEDYANKLPKGLVNEKNAILEALVDLQKEFPETIPNPNFKPSLPVSSSNPETIKGPGLPYEALKSYVSLGVKPAKVMTTNEKAYYGLDNIGYGEYPSTHLGGSQIAVKARTNVYQDDKFGIAPNDAAHPKDASYWIRSFVSGESNEIYNVVEWQSRLKELQNPNAPVLTNMVSEYLNLQIHKLSTYSGSLKGINNVGEALAVLDHEILLISQRQNSVLNAMNRHRENIETLKGQIKGNELKSKNNGPAWSKEILDQQLEMLRWNEKQLARWEIEFPKTEEYALIQLRKKVANANRPPRAEVDKNLALYKDMNLKWIHESMLDAARGSQTILRVPTVETSFKIQHHNSATKNSEAIHAKYKDFPKFAKKELGLDVKAVTDELGNSWWEVVIPKKYFNTDPSNISEFKTYKKGGILQSMAKKYYKRGRNTALRSLVKKYGAGGGVADFGAQGNFTSEYSSAQPEVEELPDPNTLLNQTLVQQPEVPQEEPEGFGMGGYDEAMASSKTNEAANKIANSIPIARFFKQIGDMGEAAIIGGSTGKKRKRRQKLASLLFSPHKLLAMRKADKAGEPEEESVPQEPHPEADFWAKNGVKIKKFYNHGGLHPEESDENDNVGFFEALKNANRRRIEKRGNRRIARTPINTETSGNILQQLANVQKHGGMSAGYYDTEAKEITMKSSPGSPEYEDVIEHEEAHVTQHSPILSFFNGEPSLRVQNPDIRKATRRLQNSIAKWQRKNPGQDFFGTMPTDENIPNEPEKFMAGYMLGMLPEGSKWTGGTHEYEAIAQGAKNEMEDFGIDLNKSYDEVLSDLKALGSDIELKSKGILNLRHLRNFMENPQFSDKQKELIMKSLR